MNISSGTIAPYLMASTTSRCPSSFIRPCLAGLRAIFTCVFRVERINGSCSRAFRNSERPCFTARPRILCKCTTRRTVTLSSLRIWHGPFSAPPVYNLCRMAASAAELTAADDAAAAAALDEATLKLRNSEIQKLRHQIGMLF